MSLRLRIALCALCLTVASTASAGAPFINLDGVGGVAFNPLAYPAGDAGGFKLGPIEMAKPRVGGWYVNLSEFHTVGRGVDWPTLGVATAFNQRLEVSYGYEVISLKTFTTIRKHNFGAKVLVLNENAFGTAFVPAIAVGAVRKSVNLAESDTSKSSGFEYYLVATKLITQLPVPVLVSAGALYSKAKVDGVLGFVDGPSAQLTFYGNLDIIPMSKLIVGVEVKQGPKYEQDGETVHHDALYYNVHAAFPITAATTLAVAFAHPGNVPEETDDPLGFGKGLVVGFQHAF